MKKKILILTAAFTLALGTVSAVLFGSKSGVFELGGVDNDFTLTINGGDITKEENFEDAHGSTDLVTDSTKEKSPALQNKVTFDYEYAPYGKTDDIDYTYLTQNFGKIYNDVSSPIRSMKNIEIIGYGNLQLSWGWLNEVDEIQYYAWETLNIGGSGAVSTFNGYRPNYFKISALSYAAPGIKKIIITYDKECKLAENPYFTDTGLRFVKYGADEAKVLGFSGDSVNPLVIPSSVKGRTVTRIEEHAFSDDNNLTSVTIPNTITYIADSAFYSCDNLATVNFATGGSETLYFGNYPFGGVTSLTGTFTLPKRASEGISQYALEDMKYISAFAFEDDYSDGEYYCEDGVMYRENYYGKILHTYPIAKPDTTFTVPADVTGFNSYVGIETAQYLETLIFENTGALSVNEYCVSSNPKLTEVKFNGSGVTTLEWHPFAGSYGIKTLILPANTIASSRAFAGIGDTAEHSVNVFFEGNDISSWRTIEDYNNTWYYNMGAYVNIYLKSDAEIPVGDLPAHIAGSWHYVDSVPTIW